MNHKKSPIRRPPKTWEQAPLLMDTQYICMLLGLGKSKVLRMVRNGELPVINRESGKFVYEKSAVMRALGIIN